MMLALLIGAALVLGLGLAVVAPLITAALSSTSSHVDGPTPSPRPLPPIG